MEEGPREVVGCRWSLGGQWALTSSFLFFPQCELSALEGMKACMTYFPRACGSLKVSIHGNSSSRQHKPFSCLDSDSIAETSEHLSSDCSITSVHSYNYTNL